MTLDFLEDLKAACEKEGRYYVFAIFPHDLSGATISSSLPDDQREEAINAIRAGLHDESEWS